MKLTSAQLSGQALQSMVERVDKQIMQLNSSILEQEKSFVILTQAIFLLKDVLMLEEALPFSLEKPFSDMRRHLHFVNHFNERGNFEMTLENANDLIHDFQAIQRRIQQHLRATTEGGKIAKKASKILTIEDIIEDVTDKLRPIIREQPKNEREVQNALEILFRIQGFDFQREKVAFEYSTKSYQPDFTFQSLNLAVDAKLCNSKRDEKEIIDQINADIVGYKTRYDNLLFLVYDIAFIRDTKKFSQGIERPNKNVWVRVIKH